jgi:endo-1,4-beta-mannosidase
MTAFDVGINYWPARSAMRWWRQFSAEEFARDARSLRDAGGGSIRVFLRWEDFQPEPSRVSAAALGRLVDVADASAANGLRLVPTLFTGHMSGANWLPRWATEPRAPGRFPVVTEERYQQVAPRSWFSDEDIVVAQELLATEAARALRGHPALWAWDLGNENSNVCVPHTREQGRAWLGRMAEALRSADPSCQVTIGQHMEDLEQDRKIGPGEAAEVCDFLCMHGYPLYAPWARSPTDPTLPAFLAEVTRWLGGKDVYFEEFGMPARTSEEEDAADVFIAEALDLLYSAGTLGAMLWCFSDYPPEIWDEPPFDVAPHERFFGLWRADGTAKPAARHLARYKGVTRKPAPISPEWIDADRMTYYDAPLKTLTHLYERYSSSAVLR